MTGVGLGLGYRLWASGPGRRSRPGPGLKTHSRQPNPKRIAVLETPLSTTA